MPNLDPRITQSDNIHQIITEHDANSKFENYLLSYRDKCQKTIECNSHAYPTYLERYQQIIEMIDWTLKRYRIAIQKNNIQQKQN